MAADLHRVLGGHAPHTSGMFADTTLDGDEIGTLVVIIDRAKNLPNRKTMGKQDPYCAARLGKEAQKTETDRRGGQTPRWDQELRFVVHESPDYHNLKLSLFNDDKKAELIGETWINLDEVLKRGGGQSDDWHPLSCKNKYAGEIRIELTYYDSRARPEKNKDSVKERKKSVVEGMNADSARIASGPRQLPIVKRRPLPMDPASASPTTSDPRHGSGQMPQAYAPDSFDQYSVSQRATHASPAHNNQGVRSEPTAFAQASHPALEPSVGHHVSLRHPSPRRKPVQTPYESAATYSATPEVIEEDDGFFEYSDDPYALQAVDAAHDTYREPVESTGWPSQPAQPRHHRIDALSTTPVQKSYHPPLPHTQSAPVLGEQAHSPQTRVNYDNHDYENTQKLDVSPRNNNNQIAPANNGYGYAHDAYYNDGNDQYDENEPPPPPPPVHRNSAPPGVVYAPRMTSAPQGMMIPRPLHTAASAGGLRSGQDPYSSRQPPPQQYQNHNSPNQRMIGSPHSPSQRPEWGRSAGAPGYNRPSPQNYQNGWQQSSPTYQYDAVFSEPDYGGGDRSNRILDHPQQRGVPPAVQNVANMQHYQRSSSLGPQGVVQPLNQRVNNAGGQYQGAQNQRVQTPRKSIDPQSPHLRQTTPYSPDSYANFITRSNHATPTPTHAPNPRHSPHPLTPTAQPLSSPPTEPSPILRSDGKEVDPGDQIPANSWAPEPERKGGSRPSVVVNVKRFGPRSAPTTPLPTRQQAGVASPGSPYTPNPSKSPAPGASARGRLQRQPSPRGNSPLTPSSSQALNSNYSSAYPPPVPGKIPLGYSSTVEDYGSGGQVSTLSQEMRSIDLNNNGDRGRRNRFRA